MFKQCITFLAIYGKLQQYSIFELFLPIRRVACLVIDSRPFLTHTQKQRNVNTTFGPSV